MPLLKNRKIYFFTPTFSPVGGVIKIFDYLNHALSFGMNPIVVCPKKYHFYRPLFKNPQFQHIKPHKGISFLQPEQMKISKEDFVFFSSPPDYFIIEKKLPTNYPTKRLIHLLQNVNQANPETNQGLDIKVLSYSMSRIACLEPILTAIKPHIDPNDPVEMILLGHNIDFFSKARSGGLPKKINVGYTTWKNKLGDEVASRIKKQRRQFAFKSIRGKATWPKLKDFYHWTDVFLCTPDREEGIYLPGVEAMAAGSIVVTPDAVGNRVYCQFDQNCVYTEWGSAGSYINALTSLAEMPSQEIDKMRSQGYKAIRPYSLTQEREKFRIFLNNLSS